MGDIVSLIEQAQKTFDEEESKRLAEKMVKDEFTLQDFLEQMLAMLRRGGLLMSVRGPRGGYKLNRPPTEITVAEIVTCLEGEAAGRPLPPQRTPEFDVLHSLAVDLLKQRQELMAGTTLQHLMERRDALSQSQAMYFI